jgi:AAA+ superfamily predicted ATPase
MTSTRVTTEIVDRLPPTAHNHFLLHFYAAVSRLLAYVDRLDAAADRLGGIPPSASRQQFLAGYRAELGHTGQPDATWDGWEALVTTWEDNADGHLPLKAVASSTGLDFRCRVGLLLISLAEIDSRFGTLFAEIQAPLAHRRLCLETLGHVMADAGWDNGLLAWDVGQRLIASGMAEVINPEAPRSEWQLRVPATLWDLVQGRRSEHMEPWFRMHGAETFAGLTELPIPADLRDRLEQLPDLLRTGQLRGLVLRGAQGSDRLEIMGALAASMGLGLAEIDLPLTSSDPEAPSLARHRLTLGPLCVMARTTPVFTPDLGPGETVELPTLPGFDGFVGVLLGQEGGVRGPLAERALTLTVPMPAAAERRRVWEGALAGTAVEDLDALVGRYHLPTGHIRRAASLAVAQAALDGRTTVIGADVAAASRSLNRQQLDTLATRIDVRGQWSDLVVNEVTAAKLADLEHRCTERERLLERLGPAFRSTTNRGVRALFTGSSGTGKTLAASILASVLGMDLYRVDLSAVVNKYIGETEKNLNRVLSRAEELDVVLLLDEGDSLLGNRTDVKSANDRYANLETNYLLQRLESYEGVVVVTTNANQLIDRAFQRRIDIVVNFVPPGTVERHAIWGLHLPPDHAVDRAFLADVAQRCPLSGGQIRNAALSATLLAMASKTALGDEHLLEAVEGEYRKAGALCPLRDDGQARAHHGGVESFVASFQGPS